MYEKLLSLAEEGVLNTSQLTALEDIATQRAGIEEHGEVVLTERIDDLVVRGFYADALDLAKASGVDGETERIEGAIKDGVSTKISAAKESLDVTEYIDISASLVKALESSNFVDRVRVRDVVDSASILHNTYERSMVNATSKEERDTLTLEYKKDAKSLGKELKAERDALIKMQGDELEKAKTALDNFDSVDLVHLATILSSDDFRVIKSMDDEVEAKKKHGNKIDKIEEATVAHLAAVDENKDFYVTGSAVNYLTDRPSALTAKGLEEHARVSSEITELWADFRKSDEYTDNLRSMGGEDFLLWSEKSLEKVVKEYRRHGKEGAPPVQSYGGSEWQGFFPGNFPLVTNDDGSESNVMLATGEWGGKFIVFPTMEDGLRLEDTTAWQKVLDNGIGNYPAFGSQEEADEWAKSNHGKISEKGSLSSLSPEEALSSEYTEFNNSTLPRQTVLKRKLDSRTTVDYPLSAGDYSDNMDASASSPHNAVLRWGSDFTKDTRDYYDGGGPGGPVTSDILDDLSKGGDILDGASLLTQLRSIPREQRTLGWLVSVQSSSLVDRQASPYTQAVAYISQYRGDSISLIQSLATPDVEGAVMPQGLTVALTRASAAAANNSWLTPAEALSGTYATGMPIEDLAVRHNPRTQAYFFSPEELEEWKNTSGVIYVNGERGVLDGSDVDKLLEMLDISLDDFLALQDQII
jgi:hypothetical protein